MSLDIYLVSAPGPKGHICECPRCGNSHFSEAEREFFSANITHNLNKMAGAAGIYLPLWHPEEAKITTAGQLAELLRPGIATMEADPARFRQFDAANGWGTYNDFMPWLRELLQACENNPEALIRVSI